MRRQQSCVLEISFHLFPVSKTTIPTPPSPLHQREEFVIVESAGRNLTQEEHLKFALDGERIQGANKRILVFSGHTWPMHRIAGGSPEGGSKLTEKKDSATALGTTRVRLAKSAAASCV